MAKGSNKATLQRRDAKRRKRALQKRRSATKGTLQRFDEGFSDGTIPMQPHPDKLSTRILELTEGMVDEASSDCSEQRKLTQFAIIAWNASLKDDPTSEINSFISRIGNLEGDVQSGIEQILFHMVSRKKALYPTDKRLAVSHQLECKNGNLNLVVVSAIPPPSAMMA
jgi:hypothetical protein